MLVRQQRRIAADAERSGRPVVMEGRDIGTVVFPGADFKFYLTADARVRAARRASQLRERGETVDEEAVLAEIVERDRLDRTRKHSPLRRADDAVVIDTTDRTFEEQVDRILRTISGNAP
jgi:cytidylate kinase